MFQLQQITITGLYRRETKKLNFQLKFISHPKLHIIMILMGINKTYLLIQKYYIYISSSSYKIYRKRWV